MPSEKEGASELTAEVARLKAELAESERISANRLQAFEDSTRAKMLLAFEYERTRKALEAIPGTIEKAMTSYTLSQQHQIDGGSLTLADVLTPTGEETVKTGNAELADLIDHVCGELPAPAPRSEPKPEEPVDPRWRYCCVCGEDLDATHERVGKTSYGRIVNGVPMTWCERCYPDKPAPRAEACECKGSIAQRHWIHGICQNCGKPAAPLARCGLPLAEAADCLDDRCKYRGDCGNPAPRAEGKG
jgi:hypothetical protein